MLSAIGMSRDAYSKSKLAKAHGFKGVPRSQREALSKMATRRGVVGETLRILCDSKKPDYEKRIRESRKALNASNARAERRTAAKLTGRYAVACHEAGHSLVNFLRTGKAFSVVVSDDLLEGSANVPVLTVDAIVAGACASAMSEGSAVEFEDMSQKDKEVLAETLGETSTLFIWQHRETRLALARVQRDLQQNWQTIEAIAAALVERGRLSGDEVRAIIEGQR